MFPATVANQNPAETPTAETPIAETETSTLLLPPPLPPPPPPQFFHSQDDAMSNSDSGFCPSSFGNVDAGSSMQSQVNSYVFENGRRYHTYHAGHYTLPNDEREQDRLDFYHHVFKFILRGNLCTAPLEDPEWILDIGCGTGLWSFEMSEQYPDANIVGIDLSQPSFQYPSPKFTFEVEDAENQWLWSKDYFNYIHFRCMMGAIADWGYLLSQCFHHLQPGGYVEFQDFGGIVGTAGPDRTTLDPYNIIQPPESPVTRWWSLVVNTSLLTGRDMVVAHKMKGLMESAGFVDVNVVIEPWPITSWPENPWLDAIGFWGREGMIESLSSYSGALLTRNLGWSHEEVDELIEDARNELMNEDSRYWAQTYFIHARKPIPPSPSPLSSVEETLENVSTLVD